MIDRDGEREREEAMDWNVYVGIVCLFIWYSARKYDETG